jgi:hypothetical protein
MRKYIVHCGHFCGVLFLDKLVKLLAANVDVSTDINSILLILRSGSRGEVVGRLIKLFMLPNNSAS